MEGIKSGALIPVGSLPYVDTTQAVQAHLRYFPEIPAWPQLPKRALGETILYQGLGGLSLEDDVALTEGDGTCFFEFLRTFPSIPTQQILAVKGQVGGPITLSSFYNDDTGRLFKDKADKLDKLARHLSQHLQWQIHQLSALGKPVIFFLDEPILGRIFDRNSKGLGREWAIPFLDSLFQKIKEMEAYSGIHCCGEGPWGWLFDLKVDFIHLDTSRFGPDLIQDAQALCAFYERGGSLIWGEIPTSQIDHSVGNYLKAWDLKAESLVEKGIPRGYIMKHAFFSTSCGLGASTLEDCGFALKMLKMFSDEWRRRNAAE